MSSYKSGEYRTLTGKEYNYVFPRYATDADTVSAFTREKDGDLKLDGFSPEHHTQNNVKVGYPQRIFVEFR